MKTLSLGTKKKSYNSIMEAAKVVAASNNEPVERAYIRLYMRLRASKKPVTAMKAAPRKYVRRNVEVVQQVGV